MIEELKMIMKDHYGIEQFDGTTNFKTDLGLTSFDFINLICLIEEKFELEIEEYDYRKVNTIDELIAYLESKQVCKG